MAQTTYKTTKMLLSLLFIWHSTQFSMFSSLDIRSRKLFDRANLPKFIDTDMIELYHLRSFPHYLIGAVCSTIV